MRLSNFWLPTIKETPAEAEVISHQLLLRAGMVRQSALGIYSWLPLGLRVLKKVEKAVREEMERAGAIEVFMPSVQPGDLWRESGRWDDYGSELLRFSDRHEREYCLGPTHEEMITDLIRRDLTSYKQLPINLFQIQYKFRDERRPRFGLMRSREFLMKDAYSFHLTQKSLQEGYDAMFNAYCRIFERLGLDYRPVVADNGSIGGTGSHEFHVLAQTGEDEIVFADDGSYAANIEKAEAARPQSRPEPTQEMEKVHTPNCKTIADLVAQFNLPIEKTLKTLFVKGVSHEIVAVILRGDHQLNEVKAENHELIAKPLEMADETVVRAKVGAGFGSLGVVNLATDIPVIVDFEAAVVSDFSIGANKDDFHYFGVNWERDVKISHVADLRKIVAGDIAPNGKGRLQIARGIEVGHVFQLGTKYSESMNFRIPLEDGSLFAPLMGCYGVGVSRIVAAAIEQNHDENGIIWTKEMAPFQIAIAPINAHKSEEVAVAAESLYNKLTEAGFEVLLDDRNKRAGFMFADLDLIGIPQRIVVSDKTLSDGEVEYKLRTSKCSERVKISDLQEKIRSNL